MSKYRYVVEKWSQDTRRYTIESDRKLSRDEVLDASIEADVGTHNAVDEIDEIPSGKIKLKVTFDGEDYGASSEYEIAEGREDLADES